MNFEQIKAAVFRHYQVLIPMTLASSLLLVGYAASDKTAPVIKTDAIAVNYGEELDYSKIQIEDNQSSYDELQIDYDTSKLDTSKVGTSYVTVTATDLSNNTSTKKVEVQTVDNEAPTFEVVENEHAKMENGVLVIDLNASNLLIDYIHATDNADGDVTAFINQSAALDTTVVSKTSMGISVTDSSGNVNEKELEIEIRDISAPVMTYVYGEAVEVPYGCDFDLSKYITVVDNCGTIKTFAPTEPIDTTRDQYTYAIVAEDTNGNAYGCYLTVVTKDINPPTITVADSYSITVGQSFDINSKVSVTDNKDGAITPTITGSVNTGTAGKYTLTITATDSAGNTATKNVVVTVNAKAAAAATTTPKSSSSSNVSASSIPNNGGGQTSIVAVAKSKLGCAYVSGGTGPYSFDCSGFAQWVYKQCGKSIPRTTYSQYAAGTKVSWANLQPGDLMFWNCRGITNSHVSIYVGNGMIIHAATPSSGVCYTSVQNMLISASLYGIVRF